MKLLMSWVAVAVLSSLCLPEKTRAQSAARIDAKKLAEHIRILSSDEFEGRAPASAGEEKTVQYVRGQLEALGLKPGNGDSYFQEVPLVAITTQSSASLKIEGHGASIELKYGDDVIAGTRRVAAESGVADSEMIFVGYGIVAPEQGWNDYQGLDVKGKTVVMLVNDPAQFKGEAMTYYGRWTYKFEEATRQGAAAALIVHQTHSAGYPWAVVKSSWSGPQFDLQTEDGNASALAVEGWITVEAARDLFKKSGKDFEVERKAAGQAGYKGLSLGMNASITLKNKTAKSLSRNVLARLEGSKLHNEVILYMAHWDHLGRRPEMEGDNIFNGAVDNATGTASILEIARVFSTMKPVPLRTILFVIVTAEESGLLGSKYYAQHPVMPLADTVAGLNIDGINVYGSMKDIEVIGYGASELERYLERFAKTQNRYLAPDSSPEKGYFYRSDHFNLAKQGVPVLYAKGGIDHAVHGKEWGRKQKDEYTAERYHKPADEFNPDWDLSGAVQDLELYVDVGATLANEITFPNWYDGNEFRAIRDQSRQGR